MPKPHTPFQWAAQLDHETTDERLQEAARHRPRRQEVRPRHRLPLPRRQARHRRGTALARRPPGRPRSSRRSGATAAASTAGASTSPTTAGWPRPTRLGLAGTGVDLDWYTTRERDYDEVLPWDHLDSGLDKDWLWGDWEDALAAADGADIEIEDCRWTPCYDCGVCPEMGTEIQIGPDRTDAAAAQRGLRARRRRGRIPARVTRAGPRVPEVLAADRSEVDLAGRESWLDAPVSSSPRVGPEWLAAEAARHGGVPGAARPARRPAAGHGGTRRSRVRRRSAPSGDPRLLRAHRGLADGGVDGLVAAVLAGRRVVARLCGRRVEQLALPMRPLDVAHGMDSQVIADPRPRRHPGGGRLDAHPAQSGRPVFTACLLGADPAGRGPAQRPRRLPAGVRQRAGLPAALRRR